MVVGGQLKAEGGAETEKEFSGLSSGQCGFSDKQGEAEIGSIQTGLRI